MSWIQNRKKPIQVDTTQSFTKTQGTVLGKSFGYATLGFFALAVITVALTCAWQFGVFPKNQPWSWSAYQGLSIGLTIGSFVLTITSSILAMFWQQKLVTMQNATVYTWLVWSFFIVGQAFAFSWLMFMLNTTIYDSAKGITLWWVCPASFGLAFVLFGLFAIIGYSLSAKGQMNVRKITMVVSMIMGIMCLPLFIVMLMSIWMPWGAGTMYWMIFFVMILFLVLVLLSILSIIGDIKRSSEFAQMATTGEQQKEVVNRLSLMFGFSLLVEFICLVWMLIWLIISITGLTRRI